MIIAQKVRNLLIIYGVLRSMNLFKRSPYHNCFQARLIYYTPTRILPLKVFGLGSFVCIAQLSRACYMPCLHHPFSQGRFLGIRKEILLSHRGHRLLIICVFCVHHSSHNYMRVLLYFCIYSLENARVYKRGLSCFFCYHVRSATSCLNTATGLGSI